MSRIIVIASPEYSLICHLSSLPILSYILHIPKSARPLGHHRRPHSQLPPSLPVLGLSQGLTQFQACPFSYVVLPSLSLSASYSLSLHCALQDCLGKNFWPYSCPYRFSLHFLTVVRRSSKGLIVEFVFLLPHWWCGLCTRCRGVWIAPHLCGLYPLF